MSDGILWNVCDGYDGCCLRQNNGYIELNSALFS